MPRAHCFGYATVANQNRSDRWTKDPFHERGGADVGTHKVAERAEYRAFAEDALFLEEPRRGGGQTNALPLQPLECVQLRAQRCVELLGAQQLRTCGAFALTRLVVSVARAIGGR